MLNVAERHQETAESALPIILPKINFDENFNK